MLLVPTWAQSGSSHATSEVIVAPTTRAEIPPITTRAACAYTSARRVHPPQLHAHARMPPAALIHSSLKQCITFSPRAMAVCKRVLASSSTFGSSGMDMMGDLGRR